MVVLVQVVVLLPLGGDSVILYSFGEALSSPQKFPHIQTEDMPQLPIQVSAEQGSHRSSTWLHPVQHCVSEVPGLSSYKQCPAKVSWFANPIFDFAGQGTY